MLRLDKSHTKYLILQGVLFNQTFLSKRLKSTFLNKNFSFEGQDMGICEFERELEKIIQNDKKL